MIYIRAFLQTTALIALVFGINPPDTDLNGEPFPVPHDSTLLAADQSPSGEQTQSQFRQIETRTTVPDTALHWN
jgi:hypothetical protein